MFDSRVKCLFPFRSSLKHMTTPNGSRGPAEDREPKRDSILTRSSEMGKTKIQARETIRNDRPVFAEYVLVASQIWARIYGIFGVGRVRKGIGIVILYSMVLRLRFDSLQGPGSIFSLVAIAFHASESTHSERDEANCIVNL